MAGEVIRDVILRMRIEHVQDRALDAARKQAGDTAATAATKAEASVKKQAAATAALGTVTGQVEKKARAASEAVTSGATKAAIATERLTVKEKILNEFYERRQMLLARITALQARIGTGGGAGGPPAPTIGQGVEQTASALGKIAAPVAIVSMVPAVSQAIGGALRSTAFSLFGTNQEAREKGSPFLNSMMPTNSVQGSAVGDAAGLFLNSQFGKLAGPVFQGFGQNWQAQRDAMHPRQGPGDSLSAEIEARQKYLAAWQQATDRERMLLQQDLNSYEERIRINQQIIQAEEARIDAAKEQFGLLDGQQQQVFIRLAEKVAAAGVGSLSRDELQLVQGNAAFTGILSEEARKAADVAGFQRIIDALDLNKNIRRAEDQLEVNMQARHEIAVKLDAKDEIVARIREGINPLMDEWSQTVLKELQNEIRRATMRGKPPAGPDF